MKRFLILLFLPLLLFSGCKATAPQTDILATTAPVYEFTSAICQGTNILVSQLITENVSCLHDYTLQANQMHLLESADLVIVSGFGLEDFLSDPLKSVSAVTDASVGIDPICGENHDHNNSSHNHNTDPHIWLSPENAKIMAVNIYTALISHYPEHKDIFDNNYRILAEKFDALEVYAQENLSQLSCRDLITFHDGFAYMAKAFDLQILYAIEEESGREASAAELISICKLVNAGNIPAIFTEKNGSDSAARIIAQETGAKLFTLDTAISGRYFEAMYHNIDTLKEALK